MALVTDYDCWHVSEEPVTVETIIGYLRRNAETARRVVAAAVAAMPPRGCSCGEALRHAVITDPAAIPAEARERLRLILGRHLA
jgi:5'-methylthioadenosine phosphorylase